MLAGCPRPYIVKKIFKFRQEYKLNKREYESIFYCYVKVGFNAPNAPNACFTSHQRNR